MADHQSLLDLLHKVRQSGIELYLYRGKVQMKAPDEGRDEVLIEALRKRKYEIALLRADELRKHPNVPRVICSICGWNEPDSGVTLANGLPVCILCHLCQEQYPVSKDLRCEMFCETPLTAVRRVDPGGHLTCPDCLARTKEILDRRRTLEYEQVPTHRGKITEADE